MLAPPRPPADPEALIPEARERHRRRQLVIATSIAVATGLGIAVYGLFGGLGPKGTKDGSRSAGTPLCRSSQIAADVGFQASTQIYVGGVGVTNTGGSTCLLPRGLPHLRLLVNGRPLVVRQMPEPPAYGVTPATPPAHVLAPGARAAFNLMWGNVCSVPHEPVNHGGEPLVVPNVTFVIRFRSSLAVTAAETGTPQCLGPGYPSSLVVGPPHVT